MAVASSSPEAVVAGDGVAGDGVAGAAVTGAGAVGNADAGATDGGSSACPGRADKSPARSKPAVKASVSHGRPVRRVIQFTTSSAL